ncbi:MULTISPECIES: DegV family protein [Paenibacillus]|uniref:Fatty acid-binding protein DegV n=1 Tax=Paenibacillus campinasensis TaxID=66347 RepID=A0A268EPB9_9BACL|nr:MULTISPECIES: DegV family protein [Paenibacillus]PAD74963.1 fatty acid-binding protein DegV [Paenibacillus campinasensis]PAK50205.1 fatty acid-binding protein DegV [Paenibacillus sp. 7541]
MSGKIKIFADSTCDLPSSWIKEYNIGIVPLYVVFGDESLRDGVDITPEQLYARVDQEGKLPKTAAPSPSDFISAFTPFIEQGDDILFIGISTELSSTCQNALIAASELPEGRVTVFDSRNLSCGIGLLVMKAVRAAENGAAMPEIVELLSKTVGEVDCEFVIDTLEYLYKGGRCSGMQNIIGSLLKIRPVIKVIDGSMTPAYKVRGKKEKALEQMLSNALSQIDQMDKDLIIVVHTMAEEEALFLQKELQAKSGAREVQISTAGCVICSHCGPQTVGIMYTKKTA